MHFLDEHVDGPNSGDSVGFGGQAVTVLTVLLKVDFMRNVERLGGPYFCFLFPSLFFVKSELDVNNILR